MGRTSTLLHVGYIKTATTFLQEVVFSGNNGDLELAAGEATRSHTVQNIVLSDNYGFSGSEARNHMERLASPLRHRGKIPVWSEETLLGNPPSARYDGFTNALKAHAIYPDAKVLITIRQQQSIAISMYREFVRGGGALPFSCFIGTGKEPISFSPLLRPEFLCFDRAIRHYMDLFGNDRILVLPQEMLAEDPVRYIATLADFAGCRIDTDVQTRSVHVGERFPAMTLRRMLNRYILKDPTRPGRHGFEALADRIVRNCNRVAPRWLDASLSRAYRDVVAARYAGMFPASNRETAKLTGLNLAHYGYDM